MISWEPFSTVSSTSLTFSQQLGDCAGLFGPVAWAPWLPQPAMPRPVKFAEWFWFGNLFLWYLLKNMYSILLICCFYLLFFEKTTETILLKVFIKRSCFQVTRWGSRDMVNGIKMQGMCVAYPLGRYVLEDWISLKVNRTLRQCWVAKYACVLSLVLNDGRLREDLCSTDTPGYRAELHKAVAYCSRSVSFWEWGDWECRPLSISRAATHSWRDCGLKLPSHWSFPSLNRSITR